jgi:hypothetical protein
MNLKIDLESAIMLAWQTSEDIELLFQHYGDHPTPMTEDEVLNALLGIKTLHDLRCEKLMDTYCRKMELNEYCTDPEKLAARDAIFGYADDILNETKPKKKGSKK